MTFSKTTLRQNAKHCYAVCQLCKMSFMLSVTYKLSMLSVIMLNFVVLSVVMLNTVAPLNQRSSLLLKK
jgi:hypothetical protein